MLCGPPCFDYVWLTGLGQISVQLSTELPEHHQFHHYGHLLRFITLSWSQESTIMRICPVMEKCFSALTEIFLYTLGPSTGCVTAPL